MEKAGGLLKMFSADFTRERVYVIAEDRESDEGRLYYESTGKMVWEFSVPVSRTVLVEPGWVSIYQPDIRQLTRAKLDQTEGEFQMIGLGGGVNPRSTPTRGREVCQTLSNANANPTAGPRYSVDRGYRAISAV